MDHTFDIDIAKEYGVDEAIVIKYFQFWILKNRANRRHIHEGHTWSYNSIEALNLLFPYWNKDKIRRIMENLEKRGVLLTGNYNQIQFDRTKWYAFKDESIFLNSPFHLAKLPDGDGKSAEPIPVILPDILPDKNEEFPASPEIPDKKPLPEKPLPEKPELLSTNILNNDGKEILIKNKEEISPIENPHPKLLESFDLHYKKATDKDPTWGKAECAIIKRLLTLHKYQDILEAIDKYFSNNWWFAKNGERSIFTFSAKYDEIVSAKIPGYHKTSAGELSFDEVDRAIREDLAKRTPEEIQRDQLQNEEDKRVFEYQLEERRKKRAR